ncbi:transporter [Methylococcus geothermalis]|uniref:Transporter n=1 Tax=Methylococcus geothermalis TaxID=2681310 RepID=A0A858Q6A6_9GAMM|nr:transporter [Methylococcus geothermalis]QJD29402.1 transporter [Methylococcus geothermalis]
MLLVLDGCASAGKSSDPAEPTTTPPQKAESSSAPGVHPAVAPPSSTPDGDFESSYREFQALARKRVETMQAELRTENRRAEAAPPERPPESQDFYQPFRAYGTERAIEVAEAFFKGRYNRSRARLPENVEKWRSRPDIGNPGPDLANFPNSAFTLPSGRAYVEFVPFTYYGTSHSSPAQYNTEFLLRYGLTDDIELRLFGNGVAWQGGSHSGWGFSPIAFDTKINVWLEKPDYFLPALGIEAYIQTQWLGSAPFDSGTQPSISFNFDQSLPFDIDLEYNLGATRTQQRPGQNEWEFVFQWALQRDLFDKDFAAFIHGYYNATTLPRLPHSQAPVSDDLTQDAVGAGLIWTVNSRFAMWAQSAAGTTRNSPSLISSLGLALAF